MAIQQAGTHTLVLQAHVLTPLCKVYGCLYSATRHSHFILGRGPRRKILYSSYWICSQLVTLGFRTSSESRGTNSGLIRLDLMNTAVWCPILCSNKCSKKDDKRVFWCNHCSVLCQCRKSNLKFGLYSFKGDLPRKIWDQQTKCIVWLWQCLYCFKMVNINPLIKPIRASDPKKLFDLEIIC